MRLIDADAFKEYIKDGIDGIILPKDQAIKVLAVTKSFLKDIDEQPTIVIPVSELDTTEDFGKWIACRDRLPEEDGKYLVTTRSYVTRKLVVSTSIFDSTTKEFYPDCIAWMEIPEPYKKENEAENKEPCPCDTCQTAIDRCGCQIHLCSKYQKWKEGSEK